MIIHQQTFTYDGGVLRGKAFTSASGSQNLGLPSAGNTRAVRLGSDELGEIAWHVTDIGRRLHDDLDQDARRLRYELAQLVFPCFDSDATDPLHLRRMR